MTPEERQQLISQYEVGYYEVARSLEGFPPDHMTAHPIEGKWSACEIVQHLADSEMNAAIRLRRMLAEERPVLHAYDQDDYARRFHYDGRDIRPALDAFRGARATSAQILSQLTEEDWKREGWHPESGLYTLETWLRIYAGHAHNHAAQIRRLKEAVSGQLFC
ncbi:MAG: DinB family protein [Acidobacteriota bacterium]|nr:DinB family protein [Acidobacteriota bacterium]